MTKTTSNPCSRCGKDRIIARTWEETSETATSSSSRIIHTMMICPDVDCQKKVEASIAVMRQKQAALVEAKEQRDAQHKLGIARSHEPKVTEPKES